MHGKARPPLGYVICVAMFFATAISAGADDYVPRHDRMRLQRVVDDFTARLGVSETVTVSIVRKNALLVSVEPAKEDDRRFVMSFEDGFLDEIDEAELSAVVAHELGHVWIYTHHPYLQTERLANSIALRLVSRETLEKVYAKVFERVGTKGDLARFLGQ